MTDMLPPVVLEFAASTTDAVADMMKLARSFEEVGAVAKTTFTETGAASKTMGVEMSASAASIIRANEDVIRSTRMVAEAEGKVAEEWTMACREMALQTQMLATQVEEASARAAASTEAMSVKMGTSAEAAAAKQSAAVQKVVQGTALVAGVIAGVSLKMAGDFQQSTTKLVTSAGETEEGLQTVRNGILSMAGEVGVSADHLSDAMYKVESAGYHAEAGLAVLKAAEQGAKAEGAEGVEVADALSSALRDYYPHAASAADVTKAAADTMSKFIGATSAGKMTFNDLAGSLNSILPVASAAKIELSDVLGVLASMTVHGISAQQAAQNMADAIRHLQAPTQVMSKAMAALGVDSTDVAAKLGERGLSGTMEYLSQAVKRAMPPGSDKVILDLGNAVSKSTPQVRELADQLMSGTITMKQYMAAAGKLDPLSAGQAQSFATLAKSYHQLGTEQVSGEDVMTTYGAMMQKVMGDATGLKVALMATGENAEYTNDAIKTITGSTADAAGNVKGWTEIQGSFNQKLSQAKDGTEALAIRIGSYLLPVASHIAGVIGDVTGWLSRNNDMAKILAITIGAVLVGALAAGVVGMVKWIANLGGVGGAIIGTTAKLGLMAAGLTFGIEHIDTWQGKLVLVVTALTGFGTAISSLSGPLAAFGGMFSGMKSNVGTFISDMGAAEGAIGKIKVAGKGVLDFLTGPWGLVLGLAVGAIALFAGGSKEATKAQDDLTDAIKKDGEALGTNTRAWVAHKLEQDGALANAKGLGIAEGDLTSALLSQGSTLDHLKQQLEDVVKAHTHLEAYTLGGKGGQIQYKNVLDDTGKSAQSLIKEIDGVSGAMNASKDAAIRQANALHQSAGDIVATGLAAVRAGSSNENLAGTSQKAADALEAEKNESKLLKDQLDLLNGGAISATQAQIHFKDGVDSVTESMKTHGKTLDLNTDSGRKNIGAILDAIKAAQDHAQAVAEQTHSVEEGNKVFGEDVQALRNVLAQSGLTQGQVEELIRTYASVPPTIHTTVTVDTSKAFAALSSLKNVASTFNLLKGIGNAHGGLIGHFASGGLAGYSPGGPVHGSGSDTSDSVLTALSIGEYVQQASAVRAAGMEVMQTLNAGNLRGAYNALGDRLGITGAPMPVSSTTVFAPNVNVHGHVLTEIQLRDLVLKLFEQRGIRNRGGSFPNFQR